MKIREDAFQKSSADTTSKKAAKSIKKSNTLQEVSTKCTRMLPEGLVRKRSDNT